MATSVELVPVMWSMTYGCAMVILAMFGLLSSAGVPLPRAVSVRRNARIAIVLRTNLRRPAEPDLLPNVNGAPSFLRPCLTVI